MADWNPPPPEQDERASQSIVSDEDRIGDTVFSKAWVLSLLVKAVKAVDPDTPEPKPEHEDTSSLNTENGPAKVEGDVIERQKQEGSVCGGAKNSSGTEGEGKTEGENGTVNSKSNQVKEISEDLENDLCQLWDVSMNEDVTQFLVTHHAVDLLLEVAGRSDAPRLIEICVGILGNLACQEESCENNFANPDTITSFLLLLKNTDSLVLTETTRLIYTCVCNNNVRGEWIKVIEETTSAYEDLMFILKSSTNEDLLKNVAVLLDKLLDSSEELLNSWGTKELFLAICEACEQTKLSSFDAMCTFMMTLQLFATISSGMAVIVDCQEELCNLLAEFFFSMDIMDHSRATMAALCLLGTLLDNVQISLPVDLLPALHTLKMHIESSISKDCSPTSKSQQQTRFQQDNAAEKVPVACDRSSDSGSLLAKMLEMVDELVQRLNS